MSIISFLETHTVHHTQTHTHIHRHTHTHTHTHIHTHTQVGENGSGKTTLVKLLTGELSPLDGYRTAHRYIQTPPPPPPKAIYTVVCEGLELTC